MDHPNVDENINDLLLKVIVTYRNHTSIVAIKKFWNSKSHFSFKNGVFVFPGPQPFAWSPVLALVPGPGPKFVFTGPGP